MIEKPKEIKKKEEKAPEIDDDLDDLSLGDISDLSD